MRVLELYCGLGGVSAALAGRGEAVLAVDQSRLAIRAYRHNFPHPVLAKTVESIDSSILAEVAADVWWASPPCQPFTQKGRYRQLKDARAGTFLRLLHHLTRIRPRYFVLENVTGFFRSPAHRLLSETLAACGYLHCWQGVHCPTAMGIPNRRPRFFLVAGRSPLRQPPSVRVTRRPLKAFLETEADPRYRLAPDMMRRFHVGMNLVDPCRADAEAKCFTAGYGKSAVRCGSYVAEASGTVRHFTPLEIQRLLGFPEWFRMPPQLSDRQAWKLLGNSLSVPSVKAVLARIPME